MLIKKEYLKNIFPSGFWGSLSLALGILMQPLSKTEGAIVNGSFESGPSVITSLSGGTAVGGGDAPWTVGDLFGWEVGGGGPNNVLASNQNIYYGTVSNGDPAGGGPHSGTLAAVFPNFPTYDGYISQQVLSTVAGQEYKISFWLSNQIGDATNNSMTVNWGGTNSGTSIIGGVNLLGPTPLPVSVGWTLHEFTVTAPTNNARLSFIGGNSAAGNLVDDVSIAETPEPGTMVLLGAGAAMMGLSRRRRAVS